MNWIIVTIIAVAYLIAATLLDYFILGQTSLLNYLFVNFVEVGLAYGGFVLGYWFCKREKKREVEK